MKKMLYQQLTDFLLSKLPASYQAHFYSEMDNGQLINEGRTMTETGIEIAHIRYEATLYFEDLPFKQINPLNLMALISIWLDEISKSEEYYRLIDYENVNFDLSLVDDDTADLTFTILFKEPISAIKSSQGDLIIQGENYQLENIQIDVVDEIEIELKNDG